MTLDPNKMIASLFGSTTDGFHRCIEGVVLVDGTQLLADQVTPEQWAAAGLKLDHANSQPLNRAQRRAAKKSMH